MVDPIGTRAVNRDLTVARPAPVTATRTAAGSVAKGDTAVLNTVSQSLSATAPVDLDRVSKIKKAIAEGKFPLLPTTIADRLIAFKLEWTSNDQA